MVEAKKRLPLHEWIVKAINNSSFVGIHELVPILTEVAIPKNHDEILEAWNSKRKRLHLENDFGVTSSLLEQKKEAEEKAMVEVKQVETSVSPATPVPDAEVDVDWPEDDDHSFRTHIKEVIDAIKGSFKGS